jgi:hypothetical protein
MRVGELLRSRFRRPSTWAAVTVLYLLMVAVNPPEVNGRLASWLSGYGILALLLGGMTWLSPLPWLWPHKANGGPSFLRGLLQAVVSAEAGMALLVGLDVLLRRAAGQPSDLKSAFSYNLLVVAPLGVVVGAVLAGRERQAMKEAEARGELDEARMRLLHHQLHPHVLFNALNGLAELVRKDPVAAEACIGSLSKVMRHLVDTSDRRYVTLEEERRLVADYLAVEAMRLGARLQVDWEIDEDLLDLQLHPLLLQPLVENAIKHGISPHPAGGALMVAARREGEGVQLEVRNTGVPLGQRREGTGTSNLKGRLALAYGEDADFLLTEDGGWTVARIALGFRALR